MGAREQAEHFIKSEREFHLGMLPTEQSHPKSRGFAELVRRDIRAGIGMLQVVDRDVVAAAARGFRSDAFGELVGALTVALETGSRIYFSGCGATGRLSILLEAAYRSFCRELESRLRGAAGKRISPDAVASIMTGGDYALVRSVESFEDYQSFGRRQVTEMGLGRGDVLVAISEGGETSSVIGSVWQALEVGARVFFACNNPPDVLAAHVARSRAVMEEPRIVKLDLSSGPMAIAGSTRMQATTAELLVVGAALEIAVMGATGSGPVPSMEDYLNRFSRLLDDLGRPAAIDAMSRWVELEEALWRNENAITYFGNEFLLDIFTDTTERAPTFSLPPFRKCDDRAAARPLAFVKNPLHATVEAWRRMLVRSPRCLAWDERTLRDLGADESICKRPPALGEAELYKFLIGNEDDPTRRAESGDVAAMVICGEEIASIGSHLEPAFARAASGFSNRATLAIGAAPAHDLVGRSVCVPCALNHSTMRLWEHLAIKLVLNTISTVTAARMGRVVSNWMAHVETTNKKLVDRGTRLVAELAGMGYDEACFELHKTRQELARRAPSSVRVSPVAATLARLRERVEKRYPEWEISPPRPLH